jgi:hypothetical protein
MKKNYSNKKLHDEESKAEGETPVEAPPTEAPKKLICTRECVVPDVGHWKPGDVIESPGLVERLAANPNFASTEE